MKELEALDNVDESLLQNLNYQKQVSHVKCQLCYDENLHKGGEQKEMKDLFFDFDEKITLPMSPNITTRCNDSCPGYGEARKEYFLLQT